VLIANGRPRATALIQIELDTASDWAQRHNLPYTTFHSLTELEPIVKLIAAEIDETNRRLDESQKIFDFRLLPKELDVDDDELTPTRKVKRRVIDQKFGHLIASMYEDEPAQAT
jgi:long-chain acyl-CoA synthetase